MAVLLLFALRSPPKNWLLDYYANATFKGEASTRAWVDQVDLRLPGDGLVRGVPDRADFSLRFQSCLPVSSPSDLTLGLTADDRARLYVDGKLVVDSAEAEPPRERGRRQKRRKQEKRKKHLDLEPGNHLIAIEYSNADGQAAMHLEMTQKGVTPARLRARLQRPSLDGRCDTP